MNVTAAPENNLAVFRRLIDNGFGRGDVDILADLLTEDFIEHQVDDPESSGGIESLAGKIRGLKTAFPDLSLRIEDVAVTGDTVWARLRARGTNTGPFMGVPTGREMTIDVIDICRFRGGRIAEHWGVADRLGSMQQIGRMPQPEGKT